MGLQQGPSASTNLILGLEGFNVTQMLLVSGSLSRQYCGIISWHIVEKAF